MVLNICLVLMDKKVEPGRKKVWTIDFSNSLLKPKDIFCVSWRNITINFLSQKDFTHLSESGLPGWGFDHPTRSWGYEGLGPLHNFNAWFFYFTGNSISNIKHWKFICHANYILIIFYYLVSLSFKNGVIYFSRNPRIL